MSQEPLPSGLDVRNPVSRAVDRLARTTSNHEFITQTLDELDELAPSTSLFYNEIHLSSGKTRAFGRPDGAVAEVEPFLPVWERWAQQNPNVQLGAHSPGPYRWSDIGDLAAFYASELYMDFYAPLGIRHQLAFAVPSPPGFLSGFALNRADRDFSEAEVFACSMLAPYVGLMLNTPIRMVDLSDPERHPLGELDWTILVVDSRGTIIDSRNTSAALDLMSPQLPDAVVAWIRNETRTVDLAASLTPVETRLEDELPYPIDLRLMQDAGGKHVLLARPNLTPAQLLAPGTALTPRQNQVLRELALGGTNTDLAKRLGISTETVKKHLTAAYRQLGVADRASALAAWHPTN